MAYRRVYATSSLSRGMIQIYKKVSKVREEKIAVASGGEILGELSLVLTQPHMASIRAVNDSDRHNC